MGGSHRPWSIFTASASRAFCAALRVGNPATRACSRFPVAEMIDRSVSHEFVSPRSHTPRTSRSKRGVVTTVTVPSSVLATRGNSRVRLVPFHRPRSCRTGTALPTLAAPHDAQPPRVVFVDVEFLK